MTKIALAEQFGWAIFDWLDDEASIGEVAAILARKRAEHEITEQRKRSNG